jgi:hypothetical protein
MSSGIGRNRGTDSVGWELFRGRGLRSFLRACIKWRVTQAEIKSVFHGKSRYDFLLCVTHEVAVSFKSGIKMGPVVSARRRVMRSERPLRSILAWAETRDTESISSIYIGMKKTKSRT